MLKIYLVIVMHGGLAFAIARRRQFVLVMDFWVIFGCFSETDGFNINTDDSRRGEGLFFLHLTHQLSGTLQFYSLRASLLSLGL